MESHLIKYSDIIMVGHQPWDIEIGSNFKNMAMEMSLQYRVLYVNRPLDRITAIRERKDSKTINRLNSIKKGIAVLQEDRKNLWVFNPRVMLESINWLPVGLLYNFLNKRNGRKLAAQINSACAVLDFQNPLLIIDNDFHNGLYLKEYVGSTCMLYYLRDYLLSQPYFNKHGGLAEPALMRKADIVATNSLYLADYARTSNSNTFYIGQGCEVEDFERSVTFFPQDIKAIKNPVIGYCGALLALRLDIKLLVAIATQQPTWNIVLIGPEDDDFKRSALHTLPNVYFLGAKEPAALPGYVQYFDVCINPQVLNQMTIGNYPRKIDEYLAAGKPVVATDTPAMQEFAACTYLCTGINDYIAAIQKALDEKDNISLIDKRNEVARSHTWAASVNKLYQAINSL